VRSLARPGSRAVAILVLAAVGVAAYGVVGDGDVEGAKAWVLGALGLAAAGVLWIWPTAAPEPTSTERLADALDTLDDVAMIAEPGGRIPWFSKAWLRRVGREETLDAALDRLAEGDGAARARLAALGEALAQGRAGSTEIPRASDSVQEGEWWSVACMPLDVGSGRALWRIGDPGPRGSDELRRSVDRLEALIEGAPFGAIEIDADGKLAYLNRAVAEWLGRRAEEAVGRGIKLVDILERGDAEHGGQWTLQGRDGRKTEVFAAPVAGSPGRRRFVLADLAGEQAWESALIGAEKRFRHLVELAPVGIVTLDRAGRIIDANVAFCNLAEKSEVEIAGTPMLARVASDGRVLAEAWIAETARGETPKPLDVTLAGGGAKVVQLWSGGEGHDDRFVVYAVDISDRRNLEQRFAHAQKMQAIGQMAGGIAHDFNNLLTAMIGHCDLLLLRHHAGDPSFADILQIKQNANRAAGLVRQLLAFSRRQTLRPKVVDIAESMSELANLLRRLIGQKVKLDLAIDRDVGFVRVDTGQLEQVIVNLAVNARDAMPKGGDLAIRLARHVAPAEERLLHETLPRGDYLRIDMTDTGEGILPEHLDKIFEPFFTTKAVGAGTGLGLSTVYGIVKQTGGYVSVASRRGAGTTFSIFLPRIAPDAPEAREAESEAQGKAPPPADLTGSASVLLVEDEFAVRSFAARALRNKGYKVIEAEDGEAALASVEKTDLPIDLMITDVLMPNVDGPTLIRRARALRPALKVIVISGYAEDAFRQELGADQNLGFLPKPFSLKDLAARVKDALGE
jgi:two-component system cell cycle sensor histidine kinase/response regulator CckA